MSVPKQSGKRGPRIKRPRTLGFGFLFLLLLGIALWLLSLTVYNRALIATVADPALEITALSAAMEAYQAKHGAYPPSVALSEQALRGHLLKRFPGLAEDESIPPMLDPAEALVFWLGGFSLNPEYPVSGEGGPLNLQTQRRAGFYEFDPRRLVLTSHGKQVYLPPGIGRTEPYVYFRTDSAAEQNYPVTDPRLQAYRKSDGTLVNPESFQILSAGEDDRWGEIPSPAFPEGPFLGGHQDNRANFSATELGKTEEQSE